MNGIETHVFMAPWFKGQNVKLQCGDNEKNTLECWIQVNEEKFYDLGDHESIKGILSQNPIKIKKSATAERTIKLCYKDGVKPKSLPILGRVDARVQRIFVVIIKPRIIERVVRLLLALCMP